MKKGIVALIAVIAVLGLLLIGPYNNLVALDEEVNQAFAQVQTVVQRRADLIPNLVETVKGYAKHEEDVFTRVTEARSKIQAAKDPEELSAANREMDQAMVAINAVVEAYPELKANEQFLNLQDELAGTENRIAKERQNYNEIVQKFNGKVRRFPTSLFARLMGFGPKAYFQADPGAQNAPKVNF